MAYPYTVTTGGLVSTIRQLRSAFPPQVNADTLKKWGIAPNNETYIVNVLRFLGIIDANDQRRDEAQKVFANHDDTAFEKAFAKLVRDAYAPLFELHGEGAWTLEKQRLITFFRSEDQTSAVVGKRQAATFQVLAALAGHGELTNQFGASRTSNARNQPTRASRARSKRNAAALHGTPVAATSGEQPDERPRGTISAGLTLRIEINLPVTDDQAVYDKIFKSIRDNLINE